MINFTEDGLQQYLAEDPGGPVVMLNLLRFQPEGGAAKYLQYVQSFAESGINDDYGLQIVYGGTGHTALVADDGQAWDMVALVSYPSRNHFVDMVHDERYGRFEHLRTEALSESVLQPTSPLQP